MAYLDRKYLIKTPLRWFAKFKLHKSERVKIEQSHINLAGIPSKLHRFEYYEFGKQPRAMFYQSSEKTTYQALSETLYYNLLGYRDIKRNIVIFDRYSFNYNYHLCTCELYSRELNGLGILSFAHYEGEQLRLPPFLDIIKEISGEPLYSIDNLSQASYFDDINND